MTLACERGIELPKDDMDARVACGQQILAAQNDDGTEYDVGAALAALVGRYGSTAFGAANAASSKEKGEIEVSSSMSSESTPSAVCSRVSLLLPFPHWER